MTGSAKDLDELAERVRFELECTGYPARSWVPPRIHEGGSVLDALVVGGGQSGLAIAFRLARERVTNVAILDRSPAGLAGPWSTYARMHTLRTPKTVSGPELGVPSLSVRAWYEAKFGAEAWAALGRIPKEAWHDYVAWLGRMAGLEVTSEAEVTDIEPLADGVLAVHAVVAGRATRLLARNVVLATGIEGAGQWTVPAMIAGALPRERYAHTADAIDFGALAGRRVAVVGAGASAFDNAAMALEHGAGRVDLFVRRCAIPRANPNRWMEFAGFLRHFGDLDDARKWRFMKTVFDMNQPPPQDTFERCAGFADFHLHLGAPIEAVAMEGEAIRLATPAGRHEADFLIAGTGFTVDLKLRPELARVEGAIARWSDRYTPPEGEASAAMGAFPYLSPSFQFTQRLPGEAPYLKNIFSYAYGSMPSLAGAAGISSLKFGVERLALGITRELFLADADVHYASLKAYDVPELDMSPYEAARARAAKVA